MYNLYIYIFTQKHITQNITTLTRVVSIYEYNNGTHMFQLKINYMYKYIYELL